jgi:WD40 repeat protein
MTIATAQLADSQHPWIGLASFTEGDREFFAGRGEEIDELLRLVRRDILTLLFGVSGLGKTSLLQAGLFPLLRAEDCLPVPIRLDYLDGATSLTAQVFSAIIAAADAARVEAPKPRPDETLWEYLHREGNHFWSPRNDLVTPFLAFDQFEELFTLGRETPECAARTTTFISELADLVENRPPAALREDPLRAKEFSFKPAQLKVLLAMREDYLADLDRIRSHFRALDQNRLRLLPMGERQARHVIALGAPLLAPGVEDRILEFVAGGDDAVEVTIAPALLSLVLRELNERRLARGMDAKITPDLLDVEQQKIFENFYLRTIEDFPLGVRTFVEDKLLTTTGFRGSCAVDDALSCPDVTQHVLNELVNRRLLTYEDRHRTRRVELTHDVLIPVIKASRDTRHAREALAQAEQQQREAHEKEREQREQRDALAQAERRQREAYEKASVARRRFAALAVLLVLALAGAIYGWLQARRADQQAAIATALRLAAEQQARIATALRLALQSSDLLDKDLKLSLLLAVEAVRMGSVDQMPVAAEQALRTAVSRLGGSFVGRSENEITALAISPDGRRLLTASMDTTARLWDPESDRELLTLIGHTGSLYSAQFSPDGRLFVTASWDNTARLWDAATGRAIGEPMKHNGAVYSAQFSPDAQRVVTASADKTARLWNAATGEKIGEPMKHDGPVYSARFSPNAQRVVTASQDKTARLWNAATGEEIGEPMRHDGPVLSAQFSPNGLSVTTTSRDGLARLWSLMDQGPGGAPVVFRGANGPLTVATIRSDNRWLITASSDGTAQLWDLAAKDPTAEAVVLRGHTGPINIVVISQDKHWLVTGSSYNAATLWDLTAKDPAANPLELPGNQKGVRAVAVSPNNRWLVTGGTDGSIRLWFIQTSDLIEQARIAVGRNLTANEWALYFPGLPYHKTFHEF